MKSKSILSFVISLLSFACSFAQTWNDVGGGVNKDNGIGVMKVYNNKLIVAGGFDSVGVSNIPAYTIASWDGSIWDSLAPGSNGGTIKCSGGGAGDKMEIWNNDLIITGGGQVCFDLVWPADSTPTKIIKWNPVGGWDSVITPITKVPDNTIFSNCVFQNNLFIGGNFTKVGTLTARSIAKWNGSNWSNIGNITLGWQEVRDMIVYDGQLIVAGDFGKTGGVFANNIASYNGTSWKALGSGTDEMVYRLGVDTINNFLYAGGVFSNAGGKPAYVAARWDGEKWTSIANNTVRNEGVQAFKMYNKKLFIAGGTINNSINDTVLMCWDGKNLNRIEATNSIIACMEVYNNELYVAGGGDSVSGHDIRNIARYTEPPNTSCDYLQAVVIGAMDTVKYFGDSVQVPLKNNIKGASSWSWSFGDGDTANVLAPSHYYAGPGTYPVQVIVNYQGCIDTATANVVITNAVGINEQKAEKAFKVFPNPAKDEITIQIDRAVKIKEPRVEIFDMQGKKVKEVSEIKGNEVKISLAGFGKGVYFVKLMDKEGREYSAEKVIID